MLIGHHMIAAPQQRMIKRLRTHTLTTWMSCVINQLISQCQQMVNSLSTQARHAHMCEGLPPWLVTRCQALIGHTRDELINQSIN